MTAIGEGATPATSHEPSTDPLKDLQFLVDANWLLTCCRAQYSGWNEHGLAFFKERGDEEPPTVADIEDEFDVVSGRLKAFLQAQAS